MARLTPEKMIQLTQQFPQASDRIAVLQALMNQNVWHPLTLESGGVFYMAFGAILGIGTWRRRYPGDELGRTDDIPAPPLPPPAVPLPPKVNP